MIELAPEHKLGLVLDNPVMPAAGAAGFGTEYRELIDLNRLGAFVTNPLTLAGRLPAVEAAAHPLPGSVLLHTGLPNPGLKAALRQNRQYWPKLTCPVIVHLAGDTADNVRACIQQLERANVAAGVELGFRDDVPTGLASALIDAALGDLPVLVRAPFGRAVAFAQLAEKRGAQALTLSAPPRGNLPPGGSDLPPVRGRLYGPALYPLALQQLREATQRTRLPVVAAGGIETLAQARGMLASGASAVQVDTLLWRDPHAVMALIDGLTGSAN